MNDLLRYLTEPASDGTGIAGMEGRVPPDLAGTLFRVGPGRYGRPDAPSAHVLDGDGMVHAFTFAEGQVRYAGRYVRTDKFTREAIAGRSLYPTWSRKAPGWWRNFGLNRIRSQASVTVTIDRRGVLVRDEVGLPWRIDPATLETLGEAQEGPGDGSAIRRGVLAPKAHVKTVPNSGMQVSVGIEYGRRGRLHVMHHDADGAPAGHVRVDLPRQTYFHDFVVTRTFVVVPLAPLFFNPLPFVLGLRSFTECLSWRAGDGMLWVVLRRDGTEPPRFIEAPAAWTWHCVNAFEVEDTIVVDWIGYDAPDHFIGRNAALSTMVRGEIGEAASPGVLRRTELHLRTGSARNQILADGNFEFPTIRPDDHGLVCRSAFMTTAPPGSVIANGIARIDLASGAADSFGFGADTYVGEPVPAGHGHLTTMGLDAPSGRAFLAIFATGAIADGPVATAWLDHPLPATFHGAWRPDLIR